MCNLKKKLTNLVERFVEGCHEKSGNFDIAVGDLGNCLRRGQTYRQEGQSCQQEALAFQADLVAWDAVQEEVALDYWPTVQEAEID